ncbi:retrovirus-related pol polyprotein from transposon TNT 1-94, partial [Tanacetum coccineum]
LDGLHFDDKLQFVEEPVEIVDREVKRLKQSRIPLIKVRWNSKIGSEFTWERKDQFKKKHPYLFTKTAPSSSAASSSRIVRMVVEQIFSSLPPLIIYEAVRMFIAFAAHMNITIFQMDVKTAFLNGHLKEEVYVSQPEGFIDLNSQITSTVLKKSSIRLKQHLMPCLLKKHGLDECSPHEPTYATERLDADLQGTPTDQTTYRRGKLMSWSSKKQDCTAMSTAEAEYVSLSACCAQVNRMLPPTSLTMDLNTNQILMYYDSKSAIARNTVLRLSKFILWYPKDSGFELIAYSDADHAGCKDDCKSTSGGLQFLGGKLVSWSSKKQDCTAMSTAEAEYVSLSACCAQVIWMRTQLLDYGFKYNRIPMYCDSKSAIAISCNPVQHSKTKHIDIRYHFIKEHVERGTVEIYFVGTEYQLADLFTKALPKERFEYLVHRIVIIMAQQQHAADVHPDELCPPNKRYDLMDANKKVDLEHVQCPSESKILMNIIKNHPLRFSIAASASVPWIYMAQFWHTLKEDGSKNRLKFLLDRKELTLTLDDFRTIFHLPQANDNNHASFVPPPSFSDMVPFYKQVLGFTMELKTASNFKIYGLLQPWQTLYKIFSKCLTTRVTGWDQPPLQIMQMLYCIVNNIHVDYAELMWEGIYYSLHHPATSIPYPRFTKIIISHYMTIFHEISRRVRDAYHNLQDDDIMKNIFNSGRNKNKVGMRIPAWMITDEMKITENYKMYAEVFGLDVPLTQSQPTDST